MATRGKNIQLFLMDGEASGFAIHLFNFAGKKQGCRPAALSLSAETGKTPP